MPPSTAKCSMLLRVRSVDGTTHKLMVRSFHRSTPWSRSAPALLTAPACLKQLSCRTTARLNHGTSLAKALINKAFDLFVRDVFADGIPLLHQFGQINFSAV